MLSDRAYAAGLFAALCLIGVLLAADSLAVDWFYDDLILVKSFSLDEIAGALDGRWDPTGVSTPGYRPLTLLFNHVTYHFFGDSVVLHRVFRIALFAAQLVVLALVAIRLKLPRWQAALAAVIILCTKNTWWMLVWPSDGVRSFVALLGNISLLLALRYVQHAGRWTFVGMLLCYAGALLTREDALVYAFIIPATAGYFLLQGRGDTWEDDGRHDFGSVLRRMTQVGLTKTVLLPALGLILISAAFWMVRASIVPGGTVIRLEGFLDHLLWVLMPRIPFGGVMIWLVSMAAFYVLLVFILLRLSSRTRALAMFWFGCLVIASTPGLVTPRPNNLLLPIMFYGLFLATILGAFMRQSRLNAAVGALVLIWFVSGSVVWHKSAQQAMNPLSTSFLEGNASMIWGEWSAARGAIPDERLARVLQNFEEVGITSLAGLEAVQAELAAHPDEHPHGLFIAPHPFLAAY